MNQEARGYLWPEKYKVSKLGPFLHGGAKEFFHGLRDKWWATEKTLTYAIEEMESAFSRTLTSASRGVVQSTKADDRVVAQSLPLLDGSQERNESISVAHPESIVMHASPEMRSVLASRYDRKTSDYVVHALEITRWTQTYEDNEKRAPRPVKTSVAAAVTATPITDTRICDICSVVGHIARTCPSSAKDKDDDGEVRWGLSGLVCGDLTNDDWIVDSGTSKRPSDQG